jgi:arsenate reductase
VSVTIYHNPRCSKSRQALALLNERGLGLEPRGLMRKKEAAYKEFGLDDPALDRAALIAAMVENPILIERPIVVAGARVALGRPPEAILELL